jgi:diaminohydroxyphosphoribosylaminopyrimidine deaminase/5-amino-6-(5-phosphoribosylamino)uracil reductase
MTDTGDETFMQEALAWAHRGVGRTSPNPAVGAVIVRDGRIVGRGFHPQAGAPHAEVLALREAGSRARGATLYTTLEPCVTTGRTGPCTEAILDAGVARVVLALRDPDRHVDGRGVEALRAAGVTVTESVLAGPVLAMLEPYVVHRRTGYPFVALKWAMSLDGKISARRDAPTMISGPASRVFDHELRNVYDAVLVGINTVLADDPRLTCRIPQGRDPLRIVLDPRLRTPLEARLLHLASPARTLIVASERAAPARAAALQQAGAEVLRLPGERPSLRVLMAELGRRGVLSVLIEGGGTVNAAALAEGIAHKVIAIVGPGLIGGAAAPTPVDGAGPLAGDSLLRLRDLTVRPVGEDVVLSGYLPAARALLDAELRGRAAGARPGA